MALGFSAVAVLLRFVRRLDLGEATRQPLFLPLAAFAWLLSPQLLVISRFPVEGTLMPLLMALHLVCAHAFIRDPNPRTAILDGALVGSSVYVYHALKIVPLVHLLVLGLVAIARLRRERRFAVSFALLAAAAVLVMTPFLRDLFGAGRSLARFHAVGGHVSAASMARLFFLHFNPVFLFVEGDANLRHHYGRFGELNIILLPFLVAGFVECFQRARRGDVFALYLLILVPACFVPATVSAEGVPHALRSYAAVIPIYLLSAYGYALLFRRARAWEHRGVAIAAAALLVLVGVVEGVVGAVHYQREYLADSKDAWIGNEWIANARKDRADVPLTAHDIMSTFKRFYLVSDERDYRYCGVARAK
jgi:hypothetical protein